MTYKFMDLYCGAGGFSIGFAQEGFVNVEGYDMWDDAICTYNLNLGGGVKKDILEYNLKMFPTSVDVVIGSPPCTSFSTANPQADVRDGLLTLYRFLEIICYIKPKFWVMENVPQVKKYLPKELGRTMIVLNSADFGVPQTRHRCFFGNFNKHLVKATHAQHNNLLGLPLWRKAKDFLELEREDLDEYILPKTPSREAMLELKDILNFEKPCSTMTCKQDRKPTLLIPYKGWYRFITIDEGKAIMGFPKDYKLTGSLSDKYKQLGNAVCPPVSRAIAQAIKQELDTHLIVSQKQSGETK